MLTLEALLYPGSWHPYSTYGVPTIDPASWVADVGIGAVWLQYQLNEGKPHEDAPKGFKDLNLSSLSTREQLDLFYEASAPEPDVLGDVDGFGLYDAWNPTTSLSEQLKAYYLGSQGRQPGKNERWERFWIQSDLGRYELGIGFASNKIKQNTSFPNLVERIDKFNNLYGDGKFRALAGGIVPGGIREWKHTPDMLRKFLSYSEGKLSRENPGLFEDRPGGIFRD